VNALDYYGRSALHLAAERNHFNLAKYLIFEGAFIDQRDIGGDTPISLALRYNCTETLMLMIQVLASGEEHCISHSADILAEMALMHGLPMSFDFSKHDPPSIHRSCASIFFCEIANYENLRASMPPPDVFSILSSFASILDDLCRVHAVQKVDAFDGCYFAAANISRDQPDDHALRIAQFALDAVCSVARIPCLCKARRPPTSSSSHAAPPADDSSASQQFLAVRAGIHCGEVTLPATALHAAHAIHSATKIRAPHQHTHNPQRAHPNELFQAFQHLLAKRTHSVHKMPPLPPSLSLRPKPT